MSNFQLIKYSFKSNGRKLEEVVFDFETGSDPVTKIRHVLFLTRDKYVSVFVNSSIHTPDLEGDMIQIYPIIMIDDKIVMSPFDPDIRDNTVLERYREHPEFFELEIVVPKTRDEDEYWITTPVVTPLKNAYMVSYVPWVHLVPEDNLTPTELTEFKG